MLCTAARRGAPRAGAFDRVIRADRRLYAATAFTGAVVDQVTKLWAGAHVSGRPARVFGPFRFELSRNPGAAFGLGRSLTPGITAVTLAAVMALVLAGWRARERAWSIALGLLTAGALGNGIDRITRSPGAGHGAVVDWLKVPFYGPVFNLADLALRSGVLLALVLLLRGAGRTGGVRGCRRSAGCLGRGPAHRRRRSRRPAGPGRAAGTRWRLGGR